MKRILLLIGAIGLLALAASSFRDSGGLFTFNGDVQTTGTNYATEVRATNAFVLNGDRITSWPSGSVTYGAVTNALSLSGSTSTFLRSDGTQQVPAGGGGNMTNSGNSVVGMLPVYTDTSGHLVTPTNAISVASANVGTLTVTNPISTLDVGSLYLSNLVANIVPVFDGNTNLVKSATTTNELNYLSGVTSAIQTQFTAKQTASANLTNVSNGEAGGLTVAATDGATNQTQLVTLKQLQGAVGGNIVLYFDTSTASAANGYGVTGTVRATNYCSTTLPTLSTNAAVSDSTGDYVCVFISTNTFTRTAGGLATVSVYAFENSGGNATIAAEAYLINSVTKAEEYEFTPSPAYQTVFAGTTPTKLDFSIPTTVYNSTTNLQWMIKLKAAVSGGTPAIRIVTGGAYPSYASFTLPSSQLVSYNSVTNALGLTGSTSTFLRSDGTQATPASSGSGWNPLDLSTEVFYEPFGVGTKASPYIGSLNWINSTVGGGTTIPGVPSWGHPGVCDVKTAAGGTDLATLITLDNGAPSYVSFPRLDQNAGWTNLWVFSVDVVTNANYFIGLVRALSGFNAGTHYAATNAPTDWMGLRFDPTNGTNKWVFVARASSTETNATDAVADTNWHTLKIWSHTAGSVSFQLDSGTAWTATNNIPGATMSPFAQVNNSFSAACTLHLDTFVMMFTGLSR